MFALSHFLGSFQHLYINLNIDLGRSKYRKSSKHMFSNVHVTYMSFNLLNVNGNA